MPVRSKEPRTGEIFPREPGGVRPSADAPCRDSAEPSDGRALREARCARIAMSDRAAMSPDRQRFMRLAGPLPLNGGLCRGFTGWNGHLSRGAASVFFVRGRDSFGARWSEGGAGRGRGEELGNARPPWESGNEAERKLPFEPPRRPELGRRRGAVKNTDRHLEKTGASNSEWQAARSVCAPARSTSPSGRNAKGDSRFSMKMQHLGIFPEGRAPPAEVLVARLIRPKIFGVSA